MTKTFTQRVIFVLILAAIRPLAGLGNDAGINRFHGLAGNYRPGIVLDTVPQTKKTGENVPDNKKTEIIKEVPKSRKQVKPAALPKVPVQPIKIIKPKIIKRTIGIIG